MSSLKIHDLFAYEILASNGYPTIEVKLYYSANEYVTASLSYGASAGTKEAKILFDNEDRFKGKGMQKAANYINNTLAPTFSNKTFVDIYSFDEFLLTFDESEDLSNIGSNVILPLSIAATKAFAKIEKIEVYEYISRMINFNYKLPSPMMVAIEGGKHADDSSDIQEFSLSYTRHSDPIAEQIENTLKVYFEVGKILKEKHFSINVGNEGAFAPNGISSNILPVEILSEAISNTNSSEFVSISIDAAASEYCSTKDEIVYHLSENGVKKSYSPDNLIEYYLENFEVPEIITQEDFFHESDLESWEKYSKKSNKILIGDDLTVTNPILLQKCIDLQIIDGIIIKPNQIGTISKTLDCAKLAIRNNILTIVSHRGGGETNDDFISDLATGISSKWIKCGPTRGERVSKYNRLMEIERDMDFKLKSGSIFLS